MIQETVRPARYLLDTKEKPDPIADEETAPYAAPLARWCPVTKPQHVPK
jgi:hypothetical protein